MTHRLTVLLLAASAAVLAQGPTATITGQVKDSSGASIPGAKVTARNLGTGIDRSALTSESGDYTLPLLPIGEYLVRVESQGFKSEERSGLVLQVDQRQRLDFTLQLGQVSETVEVTGGAPLTQTDSSNVGTVVENRKVVEMPLNSREFYSLALLMPGVAPPAQGSILSFRGGFNVAGASELANNFTLNGLDNNNQLLSAPAFRPSVDAIQEFKVLTGTYSAEYGRNSGGQVIVTTKSGTNQFHGNAFEFLRNQVMDAKNFFTPPGTKIPAFKRNQFGGTLGGPILRNKWFFFASYEGLRLSEQQLSLATVPLREMRAGDFRHLLTLPTPVRVLNPFTGAPFRTPNVIDPELINSIGRNLAGFYPDPTAVTPGGRLPASNLTFNGRRNSDTNQGSIRSDYTFSPSDSLSFSYNDFRDLTFEATNIVCGSRVVPGFGCTTALEARLLGFTETHIFNPRTVNEFRIAYSRFRNPREGEDASIDFVAQNNIPGVRIGNNPPTPGVPQTSVLGYATIGAPTNFPQIRTDHTYQFADTVTYTRGRHSIKFGGEYRAFATNGVTIGNGRGSFTFNAQTVALTSGYAMADLLLGLPTSTSRSPLTPYSYTRNKYYAGFVQDDFRLSSRLTLNLGMRYELHGPVYEKYNNMSNFDPATGQIFIMGQGRARELWKFDTNNWMPRVGFAWQPFGTGKTVIRGGAGFFYNAPATNIARNGTLQSNAPFVRAETFNSSRVIPISLTDPFPAAAALNARLVLSAMNYDHPDAVTYQWSFNIQQQLSRTAVFEMGYQGSKGTNLPSLYNLNQPPAGPGTVAQVNDRRPYPALGNISFRDAIGNSSYNGLTAKVEQRFQAGFTGLFSYTYGKSIDDTPGTAFNVTPSRSTAQNSRFIRGERGLSGFDVRHRFVASPVYELPFGKGKAWANEGWLSWLAGGWQTSGIFSWQTGRPFTVLVQRDQSNTQSNADRPNLIGNVNDGPRTVQQWFNTAAVVLQPLGQFGNAGRNNVEGPGLVNVDFAVMRRFVIKERINIQFRAEAFNFANHPNFNLPVQTVDTPNFGQITSSLAPRQIQLGLKIGF